MLRLERVAEGHLLAVDLDRAGVGLVDAGEDLHQRRLAGAVLPDEAEHLAGAQLEVGVVEHGVAQRSSWSGRGPAAPRRRRVVPAAGPRWRWRCRRTARSTVTRVHALLSRGTQKLFAGRIEVAGASLRGVRTSDVFELLRDGQPRTRAQLAESSGLARSTITARVEALMRLGLVVPVGDAVSTGGRPPSLLAFNPAARVVAGVDLGATHARAALADLSGTVLAEQRTDLDVAAGPDRVLGWVDRDHRRAARDQRRRTAATWPPSAWDCPGRSSTPPDGRSTRRSCPAGTATTCRDTCSASSRCRS